MMTCEFVMDKYLNVSPYIELLLYEGLHLYKSRAYNNIVIDAGLQILSYRMKRGVYIRETSREAQWLKRFRGERNTMDASIILYRI